MLWNISNQVEWMEEIYYQVLFLLWFYYSFLYFLVAFSFPPDICFHSNPFFLSFYFHFFLPQSSVISCCPYLILLFSVNLFLCLFQPSFRPSKRAKLSHRWQELKRKGHFPDPSTPSLSASIAFPRIKDICWNSLV